jgi:hypothetical protein
VRAPSGELLTQRQYIRRTHTGHTPEQVAQARRLSTNAGRLDVFIADAQRGAYQGKSRAQLLRDPDFRRDVELTIHGRSHQSDSQRARSMERLGLRSEGSKRKIGDSPKKRKRT